jgi:glycosyltransferase involved in cell wall biosynthesis
MNKEEQISEYKKYNYCLEDTLWKEVLPEFSKISSRETNPAPKISVVIANYNNAPYLDRMMKSLVNQTIGLENLQIMFIDDLSTDNSLDIAKHYLDRYENIEIYALHENTGGAHGPRNVGLLNALGQYIVILDADDWYALDGLKILAELLDKSSAGIAFAGVAQSMDGEYTIKSPAYVDGTYLNREIEDLPYDFYKFLGPQGIMVRKDLIQKNNLHFINQRVADDVTFFYEAMRFSGSISQDSRLTTYLNRDVGNDSLSKTVNETFLLSWIRAISYINTAFPNDLSKERFLSRRIEWLVLDFALRKRIGYKLSMARLIHLQELFETYLGPLYFEPEKYFKTDARVIAWQYLRNHEYSKLIRFVKWHSQVASKKITKKTGHYYSYVSLRRNIPTVRINIKIKGNRVTYDEDKISLYLDVYTHETINRFELRNSDNPFEKFTVSHEKISAEKYHVTFDRSLPIGYGIGTYILHVVSNDHNDHTIDFGYLKVDEHVVKRNKYIAVRFGDADDYRKGSTIDVDSESKDTIQNFAFFKG